jgi:hypothetical protein
MKELNPHILLVIKWLNDKDSVTQEELKYNRDAAYAVATDADASTAVYAAYAAAYAVAASTASTAYAASTASTAYAIAYADAATATERWVRRYFESTSENKQGYIDALKGNDRPETFQTTNCRG